MPAENPPPQEGMSLLQILTILRAHWPKSLALAIAVVILAATVTKLMPKTYSSVAILIVNPEGTDPLASRELPINLLGSFFATEMELVQAPEVLDAVIEKLHLTDEDEFISGNRGGAATAHDWVETQLRKHLDVEPGRSGSELIYITVSAAKAKLAADIANAVADTYLQQRVARSALPANQRVSRYSNELADLKHKMDAAQHDLTEFRARTGVDLDARADVDTELLNALEHKLLDARAVLNSNRAKAAAKQEVSQNVLASSSQVSGLRAEENKLKARMAELRATLGPNHPQVAVIQSQIDANAAALATAMSTYTSAARTDAEVSDVEVRNLEAQVQAAREKVLTNRNLRDLAARQQIQLESAQQVYKKALDGYDEAQFASTAESSTVGIAARARPSIKADRPNSVKNMVFGTGLAVLLGLLLPFAIELPNRRVRCADDIERYAGVPVLVVLPRIQLTPPSQGAVR
jgi:uncharacterized protein involved in exopolysaccharide biosynthesis